MHGDIRKWAASFVGLQVVLATGCGSDSTPARGGTAVSCKTDADCPLLPPGNHCASGTCTTGSQGSLGNASAQGAMIMSIQPSPGSNGCAASTAEFAAPINADPISGTHASLFCDLSGGTGCKPNANVIVDGNGGAAVSCSVVRGGDSFEVSANLSAGDVGFGVQGTFLTGGGKAFVSVNHAGLTLQGANCTVSIAPNQGQILPGAVWAGFICPELGDPSSASPLGCAGGGKFIFENCAK